VRRAVKYHDSKNQRGSMRLHFISNPGIEGLLIYLYINTPFAGPIFETKNRAIFLERFFGRGISGEALLPLQLCSHQLAVECIHFPRIRTFVEKRFHCLFSKKKCSKSGGVPSFPRREHVLAVISLPSGQRSALHRYEDITG